jgi:hypothetical protein
MHATLQVTLLSGMAGCTLHARHVLGMRILLDVGVAIVALHAAMDTLPELFAVDCKAMPGGILHVFVRVAGKTV